MGLSPEGYSDEKARRLTPPTPSVQGGGRTPDTAARSKLRNPAAPASFFLKHAEVSTMPHFKFHLAHGDHTATAECDLADAAEARLEAVYDAREVLVDGLVRGEDRSEWHLAVTDDGGATVLEMDLSEAFTAG